MKGKVFPHFIRRVAGVPATELEELRAEATLASCEELRCIEEALAAERRELTQALYDAAIRQPAMEWAVTVAIR